MLTRTFWSLRSRSFFKRDRLHFLVSLGTRRGWGRAVDYNERAMDEAQDQKNSKDYSSEHG
jgi:hypothetical protein